MSDDGLDQTTPAAADTLRAHAKLTLGLRITGVRDDGFHLIDAEMVGLELHDIVHVTATPGTPTSLEVVGPFAEGVPTDGSNLVARALDLAGVDAYVVLDKRIPHGGGLGGGSTDAAAVLRWSGVGTDPDSLTAMARLGADIPICVVGGRARVRGIGELVEPLPYVDRWVTLVIPPLAVSTPAAYRAWDELGGPTGDAVDGPNDLEPAAIAVEPRLADWRDAIHGAAGVRPVLAGSGATWFVDGRREKALADLVDEGALVVETRTVRAPDPHTG